VSLRPLFHLVKRIQLSSYIVNVSGSSHPPAWVACVEWRGPAQMCNWGQNCELQRPIHTQKMQIFEAPAALFQCGRNNLSEKFASGVTDRREFIHFALEFSCINHGFYRRRLLQITRGSADLLGRKVSSKNLKISLMNYFESLI